MVIDAFLACLFNVHYLIFLSMVHEYAYFYEYIWKSVYYCCETNSDKTMKSNSITDEIEI